jgi:hypothetical protein
MTIVFQELVMFTIPIVLSRRSTILALALMVSCLTTGCSAAPPRDYCFSPAGSDDSGDGSVARPFQSIAKANTLTLHPGDRVLFEADQTFAGNFRLDNDSGTARQPIVIGSYGAGRARIDAQGDIGVAVHNAGGVTVRDLVIFGLGRGRDQGAGVAFLNDLPGAAKMENVRVADVDVSGFQFEGILIRGMANDGSRSGYRHVRIIRCKSHHNLHTGIYVTGWWKPGATDYANQDVYVGECEASENSGDPESPWENRSGSGIFVEATKGATIEHCLASGNGRLCKGDGGGPVGIWASIASDVVIQCNKSIGNHTTGRFDGGGFCLDGGVVHSVLQYNQSEGNDGSGFGVFDFEGAPVTAHNVIRFNSSVNDGRRNGYAGIHLWNGGAGVSDTEVDHNSISLSPADNGSPRGVWIQGGVNDVKLHDNVLTIAGRNSRVIEVAGDQPGVCFRHNEYHCENANGGVVSGGKTYLASPAWEQTGAGGK